MTPRDRETAPALWHMEGPEEMPRSGGFVALAPGEEAPLYPLELPVRVRQSLRTRMARAQIESLLQQDPDTLDIRIGLSDPETGTARAVVASAETCRSWRAALGAAGGRVAALLPDYLALCAAPGTWTIQGARSASGAPRVIARLGARDGFAAPEAHALAQLRAALETDGPPERAHLIGDVPEAVRLLLTEAEVPLEHAEEMDGPAPDDMDFNLLRDPAADRAKMQQVIRRWRLPVALMLAGFLALGAGLRIETAALRDRAADLNAEAVDVARRAFLPSGPILDLRRQVGRVIAERQRLRADSTDPSGPLTLTHAATQALGRESVSVQRLQMTRDGVLQIEVDLADFARLERLVGALDTGGRSAGLLTSSVEDGQGVTAVIGVSGTRRDGEAP